MNEELQIGQSVTYTIAGRDLVLKPIALGRVKRATEIFNDKSGDNLELIAKYLLAILDNDANKPLGLTFEWILDNVTFPESQEIVRAHKIINGLGNVFQNGGTAQVKQERPLEEVVPPTPTV